MSRTCVIARAVCVSLLHPMEALAKGSSIGRETRGETRGERREDETKGSRVDTAPAVAPTRSLWSGEECHSPH